jgi:hypothetical protein
MPLLREKPHNLSQPHTLDVPLVCKEKPAGRHALRR